MRRVLWGALLLVVGLLAGWAVSRVFGGSEPPVEIADHTYVEVVPGEVFDVRTLRAVASWDVVPVATNRASGTVTSVRADPGATVAAGEVMYEVDERPVVAAVGEIPAYRSISRGDRGGDVAQLQRMLSALGWYDGDPDGVFDASVRDAVRDWQESLQLERSGVVELGDIVFFPELPIRVVLDETVIARGKVLAGGEDAIGSLGEAPRFVIDLGVNQTDPVPVGETVSLEAVIRGSEVSWEAVAGETRLGPEGWMVELLPLGGTAICGDECGLVPVGAGWSLDAALVRVPHTAGLVVPVAALVSKADGSTGVIDEAGEIIGVEVLAVARGMAVVEGVEEATRVQVPAQP